MRLAFISLFAQPLFDSQSTVTFGGSEVQLYNIATCIKQSSDIEVGFIVGDYAKNFYKKTYDRISVYNLFDLKKTSWTSKVFQGVRLFFFLVTLNPDVCVKRAAGPEGGIIAFYCMIFQKKFVYMTAHEVDCNEGYKRKNYALGLIYEFGLKNADLVITQSFEHKELLAKNYKINAVVMKSGYAIPEKNIEQKSNFILWVARLDDWKRPELFIEIAKKFPDEKFVMIAPDSYDKAYAENIRSSALENKIEFISGLPLAETNDYFKQSKLFVNTSKFEGFPNTFVQAAMYATPIISLNINPDDMFYKHKIGFFASNDFQKLIDGMKEILNNDDIYKKVSNNAYMYAVNNHDVKKIAKEFMALINKIS